MTPSEIGRLVRQLRDDPAFRAGVLAGDREVLAREGYDLDELEYQALQDLGPSLADPDRMPAGAGRPWYWALKFQVEYVTKFETEIVPGAVGPGDLYENWFLSLKNHVAARTYNGHTYKGAAMVRRGNWYRWAINWFDPGAAQDFIDTEGGGDQGGAFLNTNFPAGMFVSGVINPANFKTFIERWEARDEVESQKFVQTSDLIIEQEDWTLNAGADFAQFETDQIQRMLAIMGGGFSSEFKGGMVQRGMGALENKMLVITGYAAGTNMVNVTTAHNRVPHAQYSPMAPGVKEYTLR